MWSHTRQSALKLLTWTAVTVLVLMMVFRAYRHNIPIGAEPAPWFWARVEGPVLTSPDGRRTVRVFFNDAGAMHSGNHWTWIVEDCWWCGWRVVDEGYLGPDVACDGEPVPLEWGPNNEVRVEYLQGR